MKRYNLATLEDRIDFDRAVRDWARECVQSRMVLLVADMLNKYRVVYLDNVDVDDVEEARILFNNAFRRSWIGFLQETQ